MRSFPSKLLNELSLGFLSESLGVAKPQVEHLLNLCSSARVEVFDNMNHGQFLVDHPHEVSKRILEL